MDTVYKVGDLKRLISESSSEFKAKIGSNVESENKKNNGKAYSDIKGLAKNDKDKKPRPKYVKDDYNATMLDYEPEGEIDAKQKMRYKALAMGYNSEQEMYNNIEKEGDYSDNEKILKGMEADGEARHREKEDNAKKGLVGRTRKDGYFTKNDMYSSSAKRTKQTEDDKTTVNENVKTVYYKKTEFLTEGHMLSKIPDDFKIEGNRFRMKDKTDNEYLIEWKDNRGNILTHKNVKGMNESLKRMTELFNYKSADSNTTLSERLNEGECKFNDTLNKVREMSK